MSSTRANRAVGRRWPGSSPTKQCLPGVAATADRLAEAIRDRYGDRVQRLGFYTIGSTDTDPEVLREVIRRLKAETPSHTALAQPANRSEGHCAGGVDADRVCGAMVPVDFDDGDGPQPADGRSPLR